MTILFRLCYINKLRPRQNGRHFADKIFECIFLNENVWILHKISLKFIPKVRINNITAVVQIMACGQPGDKPLSESMMVVSLLMHICVIRPQWVKHYGCIDMNHCFQRKHKILQWNAIFWKLFEIQIGKSNILILCRAFDLGNKDTITTGCMWDNYIMIEA